MYLTLKMPSYIASYESYDRVYQSSHNDSPLNCQGFDFFFPTQYWKDKRKTYNNYRNIISKNSIFKTQNSPVIE